MKHISSDRKQEHVLAKTSLVAVRRYKNELCFETVRERWAGYGITVTGVLSLLAEVRSFSQRIELM